MPGHHTHGDANESQRMGGQASTPLAGLLLGSRLPPTGSRRRAARGIGRVGDHIGREVDPSPQQSHDVAAGRRSCNWRFWRPIARIRISIGSRGGTSRSDYQQVAALVGDRRMLSHVLLTGGTTVASSGAFVKSAVISRSALARQLGCEVDDEGYVLTDASGATCQSLLWAAGDVHGPSPMPDQVVLAATGSTAAIAIYKAPAGQRIAIRRSKSLASSMSAARQSPV